MPTFDIVSRADLTEVENAVQGVLREIKQRYDFKGSKARVDRDGAVLTLLADDDLHLRQMHELLRTYLVRRKVDPGAVEYKDPERASGGALRQTAVVRQGIPADEAKRITKAIKDSKLKVQTAVQGDELRVSGKKRDDLQQVIALVKGLDFDRPLQYVNLRD